MAEPGSLLRRALVGTLLITVAGMLLLVSPVGTEQARAHEGAHPFESEIAGIFPPGLAAGLEVRMIDSDERVELLNRSGQRVIVEGYTGEPYARLESDGPVFLNVLSPALHVNNDRWGKTPPSGDADASAPPSWVRVGDDGRLTWFDRRSQYRRPGTPDSVADTKVRTRLRDYRIPMTVGGEPAAIQGTLFWAGHRPFPIGVFLFMLIATAGCAILGAWAIKRIRSTDGPVPADDPGSGKSSVRTPESEEEPVSDRPESENPTADRPVPEDRPDRA